MIGLLTLSVVIALNIHEAESHGRLIEPPSRASAWRYGFNTPPNYQDMELYCGGFSNQWKENGGKCGVCGDPWQGPREHEAGGKYATGKIVRDYTKGNIMDVTVELTANHKGWFEFRLCPNNDPKTPVTSDCLNNNLLEMADGTGSRLSVTSSMRVVNIKLHLPAEIVCTQCVLQWKYNTGNSWGYNPDGSGCLGCGQQEQFYGCADLSISGTSQASNPTTTKSATSTPTSTSTTTTMRPTLAPVTSKSSGATNCMPVGPWAAQPQMYTWCANNCAAGYCPASHCVCKTDHETTPATTTARTTRITPMTTTTRTTTTTTPTTPTTARASTEAVTVKTSSSDTTTTTASANTYCRPVGQLDFFDYIYLTNWCITNCANGNCPADKCLCSSDVPTCEQTMLPTNDQCKPVGLWTYIPGMTCWCRVQCAIADCYGEMCKCDDEAGIP